MSYKDIIELVLGHSSASIIHEAKVLVVGAGGIGCELLKNLVLSGFQFIHIVDLDTIDATNLNRQFLFRKQHVGCSKAKVAREAVLKFNPNIHITAHHDNIKQAKFGPDFIQQFNIVLNALDNNDARRHVNRLCVSLNIPLIDSGSTGYNGQVTPIIKHLTSCFECYPVPRQKGFPVCTIRSTPQKPEHCIAWAKYLFELLFGPEDEGNILSDLGLSLKAPSMNTEEQISKNIDFSREFCRRIFQFAFDSEIQRQLMLKEVWEGKTAPTPLTTSDYFDNTNSLISPPSNIQALSRQSRRIPWSKTECVAKLLESISEMFISRCSSIGNAVFDKDDDVAMDFVTAAANLRMTNYGINCISRWDAESIAGAIIPAIASTNAIVAGIQVVQAIHILSCMRKIKVLDSSTDVSSRISCLQQSGVKHVWIKQFPLGPYILLPEVSDVPVADCYVCQSHVIYLNLHSLKIWTLAAFVQHILNDELNCKEPIIELSQTRLCIYNPDMEEDDENFKERQHLSLSSWGIQNGSSLFVLDTLQGLFECEIIISEAPDLIGAHDPLGDERYTLYSMDRASTLKNNVSSITRPIIKNGKRSRDAMTIGEEISPTDPIITVNDVIKKRKLDFVEVIDSNMSHNQIKKSESPIKHSNSNSLKDIFVHQPQNDIVTTSKDCVYDLDAEDDSSPSCKTHTIPEKDDLIYITSD